MTPTPPATPPPARPGGSSPDPGGALAGLARQIEALRVDVDQLRATPARIDKLAHTVTDLTHEVHDLLAAAEDGEPAKPRPSWIAPAEAPTTEDTVALLADLVAWVDQVYLEYPDALTGLPGCWPWHPHAVEELLWLRWSHDHAYAGPTGSTQAVADWHDRHRPGVTRRLSETLGTCSLDSHVPGARRPRTDTAAGRREAAGVTGLAEAIEPVAFWWSTNRDAEPPTPTPAQLAAEARPVRPLGSPR